MARSNFKKLYLSYEDLYYDYFVRVLEQSIPTHNSYRCKTINNLTCDAEFAIHNGRQHPVIYKSSEFSIGRKLGMFSKTRKPFFFRSKRKKKK